MVVTFDDEKKSAKLSLRQEEILEKLSSIVKDIDAGCPEQSVFVLGTCRSELSYCAQHFGAHLSSRVWSVHAGIYAWFPLHWLHPGPFIG